MAGAGDRTGPRDKQPLNLARIVQRLLTSPFGWAVDELRAELGISERTYRKYRRNLQLLFDPWFHEGETLLEEARHPGSDRRYLRLRDAASPCGEVLSLLTHLSALHLAGALMHSLGEGELSPPLLEFTQAFGRESQRRFPQTFGRVNRDLDRMLLYLPDAPKSYAGQEDKIRELLRCIVFHRRVRFRYDAASGEPATHEVEPLTLLTQ